ncbi:MAG: prepilin-type N-terminal cleavage/methylation domain-containing protein [Bdellovibrionales bacterium]|nr:prepilin-type N-terminal cleavage/methylation domain-containing protein [Bdellovibrionales bacterium]
MTDSSTCPNRTDERGFTLVELLVATGLTSIVLATVIGHVLIIRQGYFDDIIRTRINSNLRSAMDIISMNIRQAGENLAPAFPAVVLENGLITPSDTLVLRRALIAEVLTICVDASSGDTTLSVSSAAAGSSDCTPSNIASVHASFEEYRTNNGEDIRAFVYDQLTGEGEFVDYTGGGISSGEYFLNISSLQNDFTARTSYVYLIEEYRFSQNPVEQTLVLTADGETDQPQTVAFSVSQFEVSIQLEDGSVVDELTFASATDWRDIQRISVTLVGQEARKSRVLEASITAEYFPRNVLSL